MVLVLNGIQYTLIHAYAGARWFRCTLVHAGPGACLYILVHTGTCWSWCTLVHLVLISCREYIHRVGRTARGSERGSAMLLLREEEEAFIDLLQDKRCYVDLQPLSGAHLKHTLQLKVRALRTVYNSIVTSCLLHLFIITADLLMIVDFIGDELIIRLY